MKNRDNRIGLLFMLLLVTAYAGPGLSYSKAYLFHGAFAAFAVSVVWHGEARWFVRSLRAPKTSFYLVPFFLVSVAWFALSIMWVDDVLLGLRYLVFLGMGYGLVSFMVMRLTGKPRLYDAVRVLLAVFVVEAGIGLLETLTSFRWPVSRYSSWAETFGRTNDYGILSQVPFVKRYVDSSPTGFAWNSNNFSVVMSLFFPFFLIHRNQKVAVAGGLLILFLILMAGSRIAFLACAIISLVALAVEGRWLKWRAITVFLAVITLSTGFFTLRPTGIAKIDEIYIVKGSRPIYDKQFKLQTEYSRATRIELFNDGLEALGSTRGLGLGGGNFEAYRKSNAPPGEKVVTSLHNFWFEILVEGGVAFAALFYAWWLFLARSLYRAGQACADDRFRYLLNGTLLAMVIFGISAVSMSGAVYFLPMYLLLGLVVSILKIDRDHESRVEGPAAG